tara:strand:+ start:1176 stop:2039 length:864 start_codon:yes stop_codon:yes gene_type:complete
MKSNALNHPKTIRLKARLNLATWEAVGILDTLFIFTAVHAPTGFIGKWRNEEIAVFLDYKGDADELFNALVESGYLEFDDDGLLWVHDWDDHKPKYIKDRETKAIKRKENKVGDATPTNSAASASYQAKPSQAKPKIKKVDNEVIENFTQAWNTAKGNRPIHRMTTPRKRLIATRAENPEWLEDYPKALAKFPLPAFSDGKWSPNIKWFLRPDTVAEIIEGRYDFRPDGKPVAAPPRKEKTPRVKHLEQRRSAITSEIRDLVKQGLGTSAEAEELKTVLATIEEELG